LVSNSTLFWRRSDPGARLSDGIQHISNGLPIASPSRDDGREVAVKMVYNLGVNYCRGPEMKLKKSPKRLKKALKLAATKPLSRNPWIPTSQG
jgi:hypothetical protein